MKGVARYTVRIHAYTPSHGKWLVSGRWSCWVACQPYTKAERAQRFSRVSLLRYIPGRLGASYSGTEEKFAGSWVFSFAAANLLISFAWKQNDHSTIPTRHNLGYPASSLLVDLFRQQ